MRNGALWHDGLLAALPPARHRRGTHPVRTAPGAADDWHDGRRHPRRARGHPDWEVQDLSSGRVAYLADRHLLAFTHDHHHAASHVVALHVDHGNWDGHGNARDLDCGAKRSATDRPRRGDELKHLLPVDGRIVWRRSVWRDHERPPRVLVPALREVNWQTAHLGDLGRI